MSRPLRFERVRIHRMPGFATQGPALEHLSPGVNIVYGPNGSGKTTSALAIESLIWPRANPTQRAHLDGLFRIGDEGWSVEVDRDWSVHKRHGIAQPAPVLPPEEDRVRYRLSLHELLSADATGAGFARAIIREAAGGFDLDRARAKLPPATPATTRSTEHKAVMESTAAVQEARRAQEELRGQEARLAELYRERADAEEARSRVVATREAIACAEARGSYDAARARAAEFPAALGRMAGDEAERLESAEAELAAAEDEARVARAKIGDAEQAIAVADLPNEVDGPAIAGLRRGVADLSALEKSLADRESAMQKAAAILEKARGAIGPAADDDRLDEIDLSAINRLEEESEKLAQLRGQCAALEWRMSLLAREEDVEHRASTPLDELAAAERLLLRWLRARPAGDGPNHRSLAIGAGIVLVLAGFGLALIQPIATIAAAAGVAILLLALRGRAPAPDEREAAQREYREMGIREPTAWTGDGVRARLDAIRREIATVALQGARRVQHEQHAAELEALEPLVDAAEERRRDVAERLGLSGDGLSGLVWLASRVAGWQAARAELAGAEAAYVNTRRQLADAAAQLRVELSRLADDVGDHANRIAVLVDRLEERRQNRDAARLSIESATDALKSAEDRAGRARETIARLYAQMDLDPGDRPALLEMSRRFGEYRLAADTLQSARIEARLAEDRLKKAGGVDLIDRSPAELEAELGSAESDAARFEEISAEIVRIEDRIRRAKKKTDLEAQLASRAAALESLRDRRDTETRGIIADHLARFIRDSTEEAHRPAVLNRADTIFSRITNGRYSLKVTPHPVQFSAYDSEKEEFLSLDQLSSGTRVQLLIAVRVAFVETREGEIKLPLVLDEVLGNSDDERTQAIMDAVIHLAREGRQIFYLTAQHDEVAKWEARLGGAAVEARIIDIVAEKPRRLVRLDHFAIAPRPTVPPPNGASHREYAGSLSVPALSRHHTRIGGLHLWYLIDDCDGLHEVMRAGIVTWGQLDQLTKKADGKLFDPRLVRRTRALARAAEEWLECDRIGAGRLVDREALAEAGCISDVFMEQVDERRRALGGDAVHLLESLEAGDVRNFRRATVEKLREAFEMGGYIDTRSPLSRDDIRARVLGVVADEIGSEIVSYGDVDDLIQRLEVGIG